MKKCLFIVLSTIISFVQFSYGASQLILTKSDIELLKKVCNNELDEEERSIHDFLVQDVAAAKNKARAIRAFIDDFSQKISTDDRRAVKTESVSTDQIFSWIENYELKKKLRWNTRSFTHSFEEILYIQRWHD